MAIASSHLTQLEVHGALSVLAEADATNPGRPFAPELVAMLAEVVGADRDADYREIDHDTCAMHHVAEHQPVAIPSDIWTAHVSLCEDFYPLREMSIGAATEALTLSDLCSPREQRRNPYVQEVLRPLGIAHEMKVFLPAPTGTSRVFTFSRGGGRNFAERDRGVLTLLRPHLARLRERWQQTTGRGSLTAREHEIVGLLATGMKNQEIAAQLVISIGTVRKHLNNIYEKLNVNTRTGAVAAARTPSRPVHSRP